MVGFLLLFGAVAVPAAVPSEEITPAQVSVRFAGSEAFAFLDGHVASQDESNGMMWASLLLASQLANAIQASGAYPGCAGVLQGKVWNQITSIQTKYGAFYNVKGCVTVFGAAGHYGSKCHWIADPGGTHYALEQSAWKAMRSCLQGRPVPRDAALAARIAPFLDGVDLRVEGGIYVSPAAFASPPRPPFDKRLFEEGSIGTDVTPPPLDDEDRRLLAAATTAHHSTMCGYGGPPPLMTVSAAQAAYVARCDAKGLSRAGATACRLFRQLARFNGGMDPGWPADDQCTWRAIEHAQYEAWTALQTRPEPATNPNAQHNWFDTLALGNLRHLAAHYCALHYEPRPECVTSTSAASGCYLTRLPVEGPVTSWVNVSCAQWLLDWKRAHAPREP